LAAFVKMIQLWADSLEIRIPRSKIWERIIYLGQAEQKSRRMSGSSTVSLASGTQSPISAFNTSHSSLQGALKRRNICLHHLTWGVGMFYVMISLFIEN
jgi:hypothetical protein